MYTLLYWLVSDINNIYLFYLLIIQKPFITNKMEKSIQQLSILDKINKDLELDQYKYQIKQQKILNEKYISKINSLSTELDNILLINKELSDKVYEIEIKFKKINKIIDSKIDIIKKLERTIDINQEEYNSLIQTNTKLKTQIYCLEDLTKEYSSKINELELFIIGDILN